MLLLILYNYKAYDKILVNEVLNTRNDIKIEMFLQSYKYFLENNDENAIREIGHLFQFRKQVKRKAFKIFKKIERKWIFSGEIPITVGVHVRRGKF